MCPFGGSRQLWGEKAAGCCAGSIWGVGIGVQAGSADPVAAGVAGDAGAGQADPTACDWKDGNVLDVLLENMGSHSPEHLAL